MWPELQLEALVTSEHLHLLVVLGMNYGICSPREIIQGSEDVYVCVCVKSAIWIMLEHQTRTHQE